ncbi:MAG: Ig-like domain-containing protein, partial [Xanthobacteraceae bacterium]
LGTTTASSSGAWSYTTADLAAGSYAFTATDSTSAGTSAASSAFDVTVEAPSPAAPVIQTAVVNANTDPTVTLTGTAPAGSTVTVSDGGSTPLGTTTASSSGAWSYTTPDLAAGTYAFTATDSTSAGTSAASSAFDVTVEPPPATPAAPKITSDIIHQNRTVTLTGTAQANSTVTVSDGGSTPLGTATASSSGAWSYTTAALAAGSYAFTATDSTSAGTSAASNPFDVTVKPPPGVPAAPIITSDVINQNNTVTLTGTAQPYTIVTVYDSGRLLGWTIARGSGTWTYTTRRLPAGDQVFTATTTDAAGTSTPSSPLDPLIGAKSGAGSEGAITIQTGSRVELSEPYSGSVTFNGSTGMLKLDNPSTFSGDIFNFTGNGSLSGSDQIDLKRINYNSVQDSYNDGVLTVTDGRGDTAKLHFNGSYTLASFKLASDGHGGTIVYDPPVPPFSSVGPPPRDAASTGASGGIGPATLKVTAADCGSSTFTGSVEKPLLDDSSAPTGISSGIGSQNGIDLPAIAFDPQTTLGYLPNRQPTGGTLSLTDGTHGSNIALLGSYMASSFAMAGDNHGGTIVAGAALESHHPLLAGPQHA